jgi:transcriptional regulatory protein RtcR
MAMTIAYGFLGTTQDKGDDKWRPSVSLCRHHDRSDGRKLSITGLNLLYNKERYESLAEEVKRIIETETATKVRTYLLPIEDPWDFAEAYQSLEAFFRSELHEEPSDDIIFHLTTGTNAACMALFLLVLRGYAAADLVRTFRRNGKDEYDRINLRERRFDWLADRADQLRAQKPDARFGLFLSRNPAYQQTLSDIQTIAVKSDKPIFLLGPTGAGKSYLARQIFLRKKEIFSFKSSDPVELNCSVISPQLAMAELFGSKRGAFTGAVDRPGLMAEADGGLLFLDEIADLDLQVQTGLLQALDTGVYRRVGETTMRRAKFHLISGTNKNIAMCIRDGKFREDLYARIKHYKYRLPGLKDRPEDLQDLVLQALEQDNDRSPQRVVFDQSALKTFAAFATSAEATWRCNFRDLNAAVQRMRSQAGETTKQRGKEWRITSNIVDAEIGRLKAEWREIEAPEGLIPSEESILRDFLSEEEIAKIDPLDRVALAYALRVGQDARSMADAGRKLWSVSRGLKEKPNDSDIFRQFVRRFGVDVSRFRR